MAVSFRSYCCKIVPAIQVIRNNRKHLMLLYSGLLESGHSILGSSHRSVFLNQFLSKRRLGSISTTKVLESNLLTDSQHEVNSNMNCRDSWEGASSLNLQVDSFQPLSAIRNETICKKSTPTQTDLIREYFHRRDAHSLSFGITSNPFISEYEKRMILLSESSKGPAPTPQKNESGKPTAEQLHRVFEVLSNSLPKLFIQPLDYTIYHQNIVFENNIRGTKTVGIFHYVKQVALLRMIGHLKFAYVKFDILKITSHPEDGTVKVRWRIRGISGLKVFLNFWRFSMLSMRESIEKEQESWYDGFSVFFVDGDGKVYKHVVDKMQPDPEEKKEVNPSLATKLALMLGLTPQDCLNFPHVISAMKESSTCLSDAMLPLDKIE